MAQYSAQESCDSMASRVSYRDQFFYVSNQSFDRLFDFGIEVGERTAASTEEKSYIFNLKKRKSNFYPGYDLAVEKEFPSKEERKFWARVFFDLGYLIFCREIGNQDVPFWQFSDIGHAYLLARIITRSVQDEELAWHPKTLASLDAEAYHQKGINVKL